MDCTRSVLKAKSNYWATIQEAKTIRGNLLQKSEIAYSKAISEAVALRSSQSVALHREQIRLMQELEEQALREESKSHHDFLSTYQTALHHSPQPLKEVSFLSIHTTSSMMALMTFPMSSRDWLKVLVCWEE